MELPMEWKDNYEKARDYIKKEWLSLSVVGVIMVAIAVCMFVPPVRAWAGGVFSKTEVVQEKVVTNPLSDQAQERIADLETNVAGLQKQLEADRQDRLSLVTEFQKAQSEVAKTNDALVKQAQKLNDLSKQISVAATSGRSASPIETSSGGGTVSDGKVHINTATAAELDTLPGIGPSTAEKIIAYRQEHGLFASLEDLKNVSGISEATYAKLKDLIAL